MQDYDDDIPGDLPPVWEPTPAEYAAMDAARYASWALLYACRGEDTAQNTLTAIDMIRDSRKLDLLPIGDADCRLPTGSLGSLLAAVHVADQFLHEHLHGVSRTEFAIGITALKMKIMLAADARRDNRIHPHMLWGAANAGALMFHSLVLAVCIDECKSESEFPEVVDMWNFMRKRRGQPAEATVVPFPGRLRQRRVDVFS